MMINISPGDVTGQFTAAPPTCPGDTFTFRCTVTGDMNGITIWRVGGSIECNLVHRSTSSSICGPSDTFIARSGTGFGTGATSYSSTLSGRATSAQNDTLVECFGPANNVDPGNRVGGSTLQILGQYILSLHWMVFSRALTPCISCKWLLRVIWTIFEWLYYVKVIRNTAVLQYFSVFTFLSTKGVITFLLYIYSSTFHAELFYDSHEQSVCSHGVKAGLLYQYEWWWSHESTLGTLSPEIKEWSCMLDSEN